MISIANSRFSTLLEEEGHRSFLFCEYSHDESGKPIIRFSIAVANFGNGQLYIILGEPQKRDGEIIAGAKQRIFSLSDKLREEDVSFFLNELS